MTQRTRWSSAFTAALDAVSCGYIDDLTADAKANPSIEPGMTIGLYSSPMRSDNEFQAYGRVLALQWCKRSEIYIASICLYGGTVCTAPINRLEQVSWPRSIAASLIHLRRDPWDNQ